jgi:hypothetical protein
VPCRGPRRRPGRGVLDALLERAAPCRRVRSSTTPRHRQRQPAPAVRGRRRCSCDRHLGRRARGRGGNLARAARRMAACSLVRADGLARLRGWLSRGRRVANPPYIEPGRGWPRCPRTQGRHEPAIALVPGEGRRARCTSDFLVESPRCARARRLAGHRSGAGLSGVTWSRELASVQAFARVEVHTPLTSRDRAGVVPRR